MKRRTFVRALTSAAALPLIVGGYSVRSLAKSPFLQALMHQAGSPLGGVTGDRVLVLVQLIGGNDGLNTVIPLDQYTEMMAARANVVIPESQALKINDLVGLHPNLSCMKNLFTEGKLAIVQGVGYPSPNFSHFRSTDIWLTGSDAKQVLQTGWMGRYFDEEYPGYPAGYPNAQNPDPIAIQIGSAVSLAFEGASANMGMAFSNPAAFYDIVNETAPVTPATYAGHELSYVRSIGIQLQQFGVPVRAAAQKGKTLSSDWPTGGANSLADQLRIVAQLIAGGLKTKVFVVSLGGFDSHTNQRNGQDPLLLKLSTGVSAFQDELKLQGLEDRVLGMTFSEFGRRVKSNDSGGTDHGAAAPLFLFGTQVVAGMHGTNPKLPAKATPEDNLDMQFDFRSIYASVLKGWFAAPDSAISKALLSTYPTIPIIKPASAVGTAPRASAVNLSQNYPNPCGSASQTTRFTLTTDGGTASLRVYDTRGELVGTLLDGSLPAGERTLEFDTRPLASGTYLCRLESGGAVSVKSMVVER